MTSEHANGRSARRHTHKPNGHAVEDTERCPWCGSAITRTEFDRIRNQITEQERARVAKVEQQAAAKAQAEIEAVKKTVASQADKAKREAAAVAAAALIPKIAQAVNAEKARGYAERLKLTEQLQDVQRRLEKRTANELGEEGELDILAMLTTAFPEDEISRVPRGKNGGDLVQTIIQGGVTAKLLFESKNQKMFQNKWIATARKNQIDEGAAHVVIVSVAFPAGHRELMVKDGVLVCSPSRLIAVATWLRAQTIRNHSLTLSNRDRLDKSARLYRFMTSDKVSDRWDRLAQALSRMRDGLRAERNAHEKTWNDRTDQMDVIATIRDTFVEDLDSIFEATDMEPSP